MTETPQTKPPSFFILLFRWMLLALVAAILPFYIARGLGIPNTFGTVSAMLISVCLWALIYALLHWFFNQSLFVKVPRIKRWFIIGFVIRVLIAYPVVELYSGILSNKIWEAMLRGVDSFVPVMSLKNHSPIDIGGWTFVHGAVITGGIVLLTALIGSVHTLWRKLNKKQLVF
jgi:hypothetical protein